MDIDNGWNTPLELAQMASEVRAEVEQLFFGQRPCRPTSAEERVGVGEAEEEGGGGRRWTPRTTRCLGLLTRRTTTFTI
jgi:hypothetical protein